MCNKTIRCCLKVICVDFPALTRAHDPTANDRSFKLAQQQAYSEVGISELLKTAIPLRKSAYCSIIDLYVLFLIAVFEVPA